MMSNSRITNVNGSLQFKTPYLAYQRSNKLTYDTIKYRRAQAAYLKQKNYDPYKDPDRFKSLADVLFNKRAKENYNEEHGDGNILNYFIEYWDDNYINPRKGTSRVINTLGSLGMDLDYFTGAQYVKGKLMGKDDADIFGYGDKGIVQNNWDTKPFNTGVSGIDGVGNFVANLGLEVLTDPTNLITFGAKSLVKSAATNVAKSLADDLTENGIVALTKALKNNATEDVIQNAIKNNLKSNINLDLALSKFNTAPEIIDVKNVLNSTKNFRKGVDAVNDAITNTALYATPLGSLKTVGIIAKNNIIPGIMNHFYKTRKVDLKAEHVYDYVKVNSIYAEATSAGYKRAFSKQDSLLRVLEGSGINKDKLVNMYMDAYEEASKFYKTFDTVITEEDLANKAKSILTDQVLKSVNDSTQFVKALKDKDMLRTKTRQVMGKQRMSTADVVSFVKEFGPIQDIDKNAKTLLENSESYKAFLKSINEGAAVKEINAQVAVSAWYKQLANSIVKEKGTATKLAVLKSQVFGIESGLDLSQYKIFFNNLKVDDSLKAEYVRAFEALMENLNIPLDRLREVDSLIHETLYYKNLILERSLEALKQKDYVKILEEITQVPDIDHELFNKLLARLFENKTLSETELYAFQKLLNQVKDYFPDDIRKNFEKLNKIDVIGRTELEELNKLVSTMKKQYSETFNYDELVGRAKKVIKDKENQSKPKHGRLKTDKQLLRPESLLYKYKDVNDDIGIMRNNRILLSRIRYLDGVIQNIRKYIDLFDYANPLKKESIKDTYNYNFRFAPYTVDVLKNKDAGAITSVELLTPEESFHIEQALFQEHIVNNFVTIPNKKYAEDMIKLSNEDPINKNLDINEWVVEAYDLKYDNFEQAIRDIAKNMPPNRTSKIKEIYSGAQTEYYVIQQKIRSSEQKEIWENDFYNVQHPKSLRHVDEDEYQALLNKKAALRDFMDKLESYVFFVPDKTHYNKPGRGITELYARQSAPRTNSALIIEYLLGSDVADSVRDSILALADTTSLPFKTMQTMVKLLLDAGETRIAKNIHKLITASQSTVNYYKFMHIVNTTTFDTNKEINEVVRHAILDAINNSRNRNTLVTQVFKQDIIERISNDALSEIRDSNIVGELHNITDQRLLIQRTEFLLNNVKRDIFPVISEYVEQQGRIGMSVLSLMDRDVLDAMYDLKQSSGFLNEFFEGKAQLTQDNYDDFSQMLMSFGAFDIREDRAIANGFNMKPTKTLEEADDEVADAIEAADKSMSTGSSYYTSQETSVKGAMTEVLRHIGAVNDKAMEDAGLMAVHKSGLNFKGAPVKVKGNVPTSSIRYDIAYVEGTKGETVYLGTKKVYDVLWVYDKAQDFHSILSFNSLIRRNDINIATFGLLCKEYKNAWMMAKELNKPLNDAHLLPKYRNKLKYAINTSPLFKSYVARGTDVDKLSALDVFALNDFFYKNEHTGRYYRELSHNYLFDQSKYTDVKTLFESANENKMNALRTMFDNLYRYQDEVPIKESRVTGLRYIYSKLLDKNSEMLKLILDDDVYNYITRPILSNADFEDALKFLNNKYGLELELNKVLIDLELTNKLDSKQNYILQLALENTEDKKLLAYESLFSEIKEYAEQITEIKQNISEVLDEDLLNKYSLSKRYEHSTPEIIKDMNERDAKNLERFANAPTRGISEYLFDDLSENWISKVDPDNPNDFVHRSDSVIMHMRANQFAINKIRRLNIFRTQMEPGEFRQLTEEILIRRMQVMANLSAVDLADAIRSWTPGFIVFANNDKVMQLENVIGNLGNLKRLGIDHTFITKDTLVLYNAKKDFNYDNVVKKKFKTENIVQREGRGKEILEEPKEYVVFDYETTGVDSFRDKPVQIAMYKYSVVAGKHTLKETKTFYIDPEIKIPDAATAIHNITKTTLDANNAITGDKAIDVIRNFLGDAVLVGQNTNFDINVLFDSSKRIDGKNITNNYMDLITLAKVVHHLGIGGFLKTQRSFNLESLMELKKLRNPKFEIPKQMHDAEKDVKITQELFEEYLNVYLKYKESLHPDDVVRLDKIVDGFIKENNRFDSNLFYRFIDLRQKPTAYDVSLKSTSDSKIKVKKEIAGINNELRHYLNQEHPSPFEDELFIPYRYTQDSQDELLYKLFGEEPPINMHLNSNAFNEGYRFETTVFGNLDEQIRLGNNYNSNIINTFQKNWVDVVTQSDKKNKYLDLFHNDNFFSGNKYYHTIFSNKSNSRIRKWFEENNMVAMVSYTDKKTKKLKVTKFNIFSKKSYEDAIAMKAIIVPDPVYRLTYRTINEHKINNVILSAYMRTVVALQKSGFLTTVGFPTRNLWDIVYKNILMAPNLSMGEQLANTKLAFDMLKFHNEIQLEILTRFKTFNRKTIDVVLKDKPAELRELYYFVDEFVNSPGASGFSDAMTQFMKDVQFSKDTNKPLEELLNQFDKWLVYNPATKAISWVNKWIEQTGRLSMLLGEYERTGSFNVSLGKVIKTHFDYNTKRPVEHYAEIFIPFVTYPIRNLALYLEHMLDNPVLFKTTLDAYEVSWNDYTKDSQYNKNYQYNMQMGNIRTGDYILKLNPSLFDALNLMLRPLEEGKERLNPLIKQPLGLNPEDFDKRRLIPYASNALRSLDAISKIKNGEINAATLTPSLVYKLKKYTKPTYSRGAIRWGIKKTYTRKTYSYKKNSSAIFRSIYGKSYTKKGFSKVKLATLTGKSGYYADPKKIVYAVNKIKWMFR